jgi:predicted GIY-YIG superfamily endonuclease
MDFVYLLTPARLTTYRWRASYVGCTNDPARRVHHHNGELVGGALATSSPLHRPWEILVLVSGFLDRGDALTFNFFMRTYMMFCWPVCGVLLLVEARWIPHDEVAGAGVSSLNSSERKLFELFRQLRRLPWTRRDLRVFFLTAKARSIARSLGPHFRWPARTAVATMLPVPDGPPILVYEDPARRPPGRALRAQPHGPSNRQLALAHFRRVGPRQHRCQLCGTVLSADLARGYRNLVQHLHGRHHRPAPASVLTPTPPLTPPPTAASRKRGHQDNDNPPEPIAKRTRSATRNAGRRLTRSAARMGTH